MNSTIAISEQGGTVNFHVSGKVEASNLPQDMKLQRMLGHVPALFHKNPKSVLVVGCGAGITAGSFLVHPEVQRVVICEIEPLIPENIANAHFAKENYGVVHDPRVEIVYDDARHYVLTTQEKFDIITSDPIHPWVKGAATLYTKEYFEMCRQHLNPGGICGQWVPLYESKLDVVKSEVATFMEAFPNSTIWSNLDAGKGYDTIIIGQEEPFHLDLDAIQRRLDDKDHQRVVQSLMEVGVGSIEQLCETYTGQKSDLKPWLEDAQINRDQNLRPAIPRRPRPQPTGRRRHLPKHAQIPALPKRDFQRIGKPNESAGDIADAAADGKGKIREWARPEVPRDRARQFARQLLVARR